MLLFENAYKDGKRQHTAECVRCIRGIGSKTNSVKVYADRSDDAAKIACKENGWAVCRIIKEYIWTKADLEYERRADERGKDTYPKMDKTRTYNYKGVKVSWNPSTRH